jgi:nucleoside 2-deoxyribosyltransferase
VRNALGPLGYTVRSGEGTLDRASNRWADAQDAEAGIFDFSDTDLARRAETAYLLGWAQALGMAVVLLRSPEKGLPFNAGHEPLVFSTPAELATTVEHRLARALFQPVTSSFDATAALRTAAILSRLYEGTNHEDIRNALNFLVPRDGFQDAYAVHDFAKYILSLDGAGAPTLLTPIWPPHYPQYGRRRVFHVFAYHREWSGPSRQAVERAAGLGYRAHIDTDSDDILASNWEELACANHVVVDISGFNDNVLIELGMAHALGRPVKLVGLEEVVDHLPQVIAKKRVETYSIQNTDPITEATLQLMAKPESLSIASAPWPC